MGNSSSAPDLSLPRFDGPEACDAASARQEEVLPSSELLGGNTCVAIEHLGTRYVLRATRAGKLILTK